MRIAFCGKGGSGKTSVAALFIKFLTAQRQSVLAIDGDINQHLGAAIGFSEDTIKALPKIGMRQEIMQDYIRGTNTRIRKPSDMIESTPAGTGSRFVTRNGDDPVTETFIISQDGLRFMAVGGHDESDAGSTCFHKFTGAEGMFLNHYLDADDEFVVADMCAGADPFSSSGLATRFDASVVVIEPTLKSIAVYKQAQEYGAPNQVRLLPVANKIMSADDLKFIEDQIGETCVCAFRSLDQVRNAEKGIPWTVDDLEPDTLAALKSLQDAIENLPERDWDHYQALGRMFHKKASDGWATAMYGYDMTEHIDPDFKYPTAPQNIAKAA
jgi:CO dehydrogenase maturation factor